MGAELTVVTGSPEETERLGEALAAILPGGTVVALHGGLATGKTCLARGMARRFSEGELVHSPTFTLINEYGTKKKLYHLDLYRLRGPEELAGLGYEELFDPPPAKAGEGAVSRGVCVVEWAERAEGLLPAERVDVYLDFLGGDRREIRVVNRGALEGDWESRLGTEALIRP